MRARSAYLFLLCKEWFIMPRLGVLERKIYNRLGVTVSLDFSLLRDCLHLKTIIVPTADQRQGKGNMTLELVKKFAVFYNLPIILLPKEIGNVPVQVLERFYVGHGFIPVEDGYYMYTPH